MVPFVRPVSVHVRVAVMHVVIWAPAVGALNAVAV